MMCRCNESISKRHWDMEPGGRVIIEHPEGECHCVRRPLAGVAELEGAEDGVVGRCGAPEEPVHAHCDTGGGGAGGWRSQPWECPAVEVGVSGGGEWLRLVSLSKVEPGGADCWWSCAGGARKPQGTRARRFHGGGGQFRGFLAENKSKPLATIPWGDDCWKWGGPPPSSQNGPGLQFNVQSSNAFSAEQAIPSHRTL